MLEGIGILAIIGFGFWVFMNTVEANEAATRNNKTKIKNSPKAQKLIQEFNSAAYSGKPQIPHKELQKKLNSIVNDPNEKEAIAKELERKYQMEVDKENERRGLRKFGYKYDTQIFEIFGDEREVDWIFLMVRVDEYFRFKNRQLALDLLNLWKEKQLVEVSHCDKDKLKVGIVLTSDYFKLDDSDLTQEDWAKQNGITLKPFVPYDDSLPF